MKKTLIVLVFVSSAAVLAENSVVDLYFTCKDYSGKNPLSTESATTYTLSDDLDLKLGDEPIGLRFIYYDGTVMDFSDGNHTLKVSSVTTWGNPGSCLTFKGGVWDLLGGIFYGAGSWTNLDYTNVKVIFEDTVVTNTAQIICQSGYGTNFHWFAKGGLFHCKNHLIVRQPNTDAGRSPDDYSTIEFTGGAKIIAYNLFNNRDSNTAVNQNCTTRFKDEGTSVSGKACCYFGHKSCGYRTEIVDGAIVESYQRWYLGSGSKNAMSNTVYIANGGTLHTLYSSYLGGNPDTESGDYNTMVIDEGGVLKLYNTTEYIYAGYSSSFNSLLITNGSVIARYIQTGFKSSSSNNLVRISGENVELQFGRWNWIPFGKGSGNTVEITDGANIGTFSASQLQYSEYASTNNTFRLENGASFTTRYIYPGNVEGSTGNLLYVGNNCTLNVYDFNMNSRYGNTAIISNGVVNYTGEVGFWIGGEKLNDGTYKGNRCVIKGIKSKIRSSGDLNCVSSVRSGGVLEFDVSEMTGAYEEPVFDVKNFEIKTGCSLVLSGIEKMQENIKEVTELVLVNSARAINIDEDVMTAACAALPDRSSISLSENSCRLILSVKPLFDPGTIFILK